MCLLKWDTNEKYLQDKTVLKWFTHLPRNELPRVIRLRLLFKCTALLWCDLVWGVVLCSSPSECASIFSSATFRCNSEVSPPSCCLVKRSNSASNISRCAYWLNMLYNSHCVRLPIFIPNIFYTTGQGNQHSRTIKVSYDNTMKSSRRVQELQDRHGLLERYRKHTLRKWACKNA